MAEDALDRAFSICAYCYRPIADDESGLMTGARIETAEGSGPDDFAGRGVELWKGDHFIVAAVPEEGAEGLDDDSNILMLVCGPECAGALDTFLALPAPVEVRELSEAAFAR